MERLERGGLGPEEGPVAVLLVAVPGSEELVGELETVGAEPLLVAHAFAVGGEVPDQEGRREAPGAARPQPTGAGLHPPPIDPCMTFSVTRLTDIVHRAACAQSLRTVPARR